MTGKRGEPCLLISSLDEFRDVALKLLQPSLPRFFVYYQDAVKGRHDSGIDLYGSDVVIA